MAHKRRNVRNPNRQITTQKLGYGNVIVLVGCIMKGSPTQRVDHYLQKHIVCFSVSNMFWSRLCILLGSHANLLVLQKSYISSAYCFKYFVVIFN